MTGVRQARISQLESGQAEPKLVEAIELAKALNVSMTMVPDDMLGVVIDTIREHERKDQSDRARTIPELILGDRAYS